MERYLKYICDILSMILITILRKEWKTEKEIKKIF